MEQVLVFRLGEERYGLRLEQVQEVVEAPRLHFLPRAPAGFLGAINFHGGIVPVLDLVAHLGLGGDRRDGRLVVLAPGQCAVALAVTALQRIVPLVAEALQPVESGLGGCTGAVLDHEGERINLLDVARLRASLEKTVKGTGGDHGA